MARSFFVLRYVAAVHSLSAVGKRQSDAHPYSTGLPQGTNVRRPEASTAHPQRCLACSRRCRARRSCSVDHIHRMGGDDVSLRESEPKYCFELLQNLTILRGAQAEGSQVCPTLSSSGPPKRPPVELNLCTVSEAVGFAGLQPEKSRKKASSDSSPARPLWHFFQSFLASFCWSLGVCTVTVVGFLNQIFGLINKF
jgi:hypothetical protein